MKSVRFLGLISIIFFTAFKDTNYRQIENNSFGLGEKYHYKVKYGPLTIGVADVFVDNKVYSVNDRPCYKIDVLGKTAGLTDLFHVKNLYRSYVDTVSIVPQKFVYSAREGDFKRDQSMLFDHTTNKVVKYEKEKQNTFKVPDNIQDVISGYYYLRTLDLAGLKMGQSVSAPLFFDEDLYEMKVKYAGKAIIRTRFGKINVIKLHPILPKNKLFEGEEAIRIYVSNDKNRVPIQIEVDFSIGKVVMELKDYENTKTPLTWIKK